jgi:hypothetical protein
MEAAGHHEDEMKPIKRQSDTIRLASRAVEARSSKWVHLLCVANMNDSMRPAAIEAC